MSGRFSFKAIPEARLSLLLAEAAASPLSEAAVAYPRWYLHRWHFLPEGYLSRRSVGLYDLAIRRLYHAAAEARTHGRILSLLRRIDPRSVAEFGCGPGRALHAIRRALPRARLTGLDLSPFMLEAALERVGRDADLRHADICSAPLRTGGTDAVVALHVFGHMPPAEASKAVSEAARILRPGGWLVSVEHAWHRLPLTDLFERPRTETAGTGAARLRLFTRAATSPGTERPPENAPSRRDAGGGPDDRAEP